MLLYYITDRMQLGATEIERRTRLLQKITEAARSGIDYIQLREKDLPVRELESLAYEAVQAVNESSEGKTKVLINSRLDVALATGANGVHLRSQDMSPTEVRKIWQLAGRDRQPVVAVSCHSEHEVEAAAEAGADFVVFGPVFEKKNNAETIRGGIDRLKSVYGYKIPVLALGGITIENAQLCPPAGAAGIAGIRVFQDADVSKVVARLRA